jgi:hypothetical protein
MTTRFSHIKQHLEQKFWFRLSVVFLLSLRLIIIPATSNSFDLGAMATIPQRLFTIGSSPFIQIVKNPLVFIPYLPQYALFLKIEGWLARNYDPFLESALLKAPILLAELIVAILILKITQNFTHDKALGRLAALLWLINPTSFWWGAGSGHYVMWGIAAMVASFYLILRGWHIWALAFLSFFAALYYYPAILLPLFLLFIVANTKKKRTLWTDLGYFVRMSLIFAIFFAIQLAPLFLAENGLFRSYVFKGLLWQADAGSQGGKLSALDAVPIYDYSWYPWPYQLITGNYPTNQNAPTLYALTGKLNFFGPLIASFYILYLLWKYLVRHREEPYPFQRLVTDSFLTLTLTIISFGGFHSSFILWLIPFSIIYSMISSDYRLAIVGLCMGILNQYRSSFYPGLWERVVALPDILKVFYWRHDIPNYVLDGFVKMLMLLPGVALTLPHLSSGQSERKDYFAPLSLSVLLAVEVIVFITIETCMLYSALWQGKLQPRPTQLDVNVYYLSSDTQRIELVGDHTLRVSLTRASSYSDEEIVKKFVFGENYRRFYSFRLFFLGLHEQDIQNVTIGQCQPRLVGVTEISRFSATGISYDYANCFGELSPDGFPVPVTVVLDPNISIQKVPPNIFAIATFIPRYDYLPEQTRVVNLSAIAGVGIFVLLCVAVGVLLMG